jgi:hypothetical protein
MFQLLRLEALSARDPTALCCVCARLQTCRPEGTRALENRSARFVGGSVRFGVVREKHNEVCGGAPDIAPRRFTLEIDLKTGNAFWDYNGEMEMRPIPNTRASERTLR